MKDSVAYLLRLADDRLIHGHRLSEWCGHGPILEEDLALTNAALDLVGQAKMLYELAAELHEGGKTADDFAYFRDDLSYSNALMCELPRGDYANTVARLFLLSVFNLYQMEALTGSAEEELAGIAAKSVKEARYHVRHSGHWMLRFGDGTEESHERVQRAINGLWPYTAELFEMDELEQKMLETGIGVDLAEVENKWRETVEKVLGQATLEIPAGEIYMHSGGRSGRHTEHLGYVLAEMQILARSHPGAQW